VPPRVDPFELMDHRASRGGPGSRSDPKSWASGSRSRQPVDQFEPMGRRASPGGLNLTHETRSVASVVARCGASDAAQKGACGPSSPSECTCVVKPAFLTTHATWARREATGPCNKEIPATSYSPRGPPPKYHRRWRA
jgi:hypothetical protein